MDPRGLAYHFADWACSQTPFDFPNSVRTIANRAMIDTLGVTVAGGAHPSIKQLADVWPASSGTSQLVTGGSTSSETAALINGSAAHVWDFDDTSYTGIMHGSAVIFPTVISLAQEFNASEQEMQTAFIIGSEIAYVLADICTHKHYFHGWWSTTTCGLIGATAAAARMLRCSVDQTAQAIGIAAAGAGGGKSVFGTHAKPFLVGEAAQRAIIFARVTASGLTGPTGSFEGDTGFLHLLNNDVEHLAEANTLGVRWRLNEPGLLIKRNPVCSAAQAAIEEIARLTFATDLAPDDIETIQLEVPELVRISLMHDAPKTPAQAQFSLPFAAACAVMNGAVRLGDLNDEILQSAEIIALMAKVQISVAEDLSTDEMLKRHPESARVRIVLKDSTKREGYCGEAYGMPGQPLGDVDFIRKFQECLTFAGRTAEIHETVSKNVLQLTADLFQQSANGSTHHAITRNSSYG